MEKTAFLTLEKIGKTFPGVRALDDMHLTINSGKVHALVGENGAGKSTLIKILAGVEQPDNGGIIQIHGEEVEFSNALDSVHKGIAIIFQDFSLFPNLSVAENIAIGNEIEKNSILLNWHRVRGVAKKVLKEMGIKLDLDAQLSTLSVAKQQLVSIVRGIASDAKLIIMDEPTSALSSAEVASLFEIINNLKEKGVAILFISHKLDEVFKIADEITIIRDGKHIYSGDASSITRDELVSYMVGRKIVTERFDTGNIQEEVVFEVRNLSKAKNFGDINFKLRKGEILGITGLVGAGRTEMCQAIFGINQPYTGDIYIDSKKIKIKNVWQAISHGIAYVPENRQLEGLIMDKTLGDNIAISNYNKISKLLGLLSSSLKKTLADIWIKKLDIQPPYPNMPAKQFSGGNQQRIVFAKWLANEPKILIIDEPTNGVDIGGKSEMHRIIKELADTGIGIIMISSELPEILRLSDRILVMCKGRIVAEMDPSVATQEGIIKASLGIKDESKGLVEELA